MSTPAAMYEFFVSYSRRDADFARAVAESLARLGVSAWIAESEILIEGRKRLEDRNILRDILAEAATASRRCLLLVSPHALDSEWVMEVEIPSFLQREGTQRAQVMWPVIVGPDADADAVRGRWPAALSEHAVPECRTVADVDAVVRELCGAAGLTVPPDEASIPLSSSRTVVSRLTVATERRRFVFALDIGTEWTPRPPTGPGMLLNLKNGETELVLNLVVGAMPRDLRRESGTQAVEEANYFAEAFVTRRMDLLSQVRHVLDSDKASSGDRARGLLQILRLKLITAAAGRPDVLGSHVVNVLGQPHFAYTYRMKGPLGPAIIARKYSVILAPPGTGDDRHFEFVFTAGFAGEHGDFLKRISRAESIVRSFRFVD